MRADWDVIVIGAGLAGLAAGATATKAASAASCTDLDPSPGCPSETAAALASGAHTRKVTPPGNGIDPIPGCLDGAVTTM